jgi:phospholipid/cholesterol/gamma-HCH transport system ATP-binding protein
MFDSSSNPELAETLIAEIQEALPEASGGDREPAMASSEPMIAFSHVGISFDDRPVLEDVSFSVDRGQTLCILGRSGVGKSVALRLLMGFLQPDSGSIRVEGQEIAGLGEEGMRAIRKRVTMVFQNGALFDSLSVRENVAFPRARRPGRGSGEPDCGATDRPGGRRGRSGCFPGQSLYRSQARGGHCPGAGRAARSGAL